MNGAGATGSGLESSGWGPPETTDYGFDVRIHNYARTITNPCP